MLMEERYDKEQSNPPLQRRIGILKWLEDKGFDVICFIGSVAQNEDFRMIEPKALRIGSPKVYTEDLREEFVTDFYPALWANAIYEGRYLLGASFTRPLLAKAQIEIIEKEKYPLNNRW